MRSVLLKDQYSKPKEAGGRLIRKTVSELRRAGMALPISSHILIGVSGGSDSLALAHLILKYGRRVVDPSRVMLLHVNHGWRGKASDADADFVVRFGKRWGVPVLLHKLEPPALEQLSGESWEDRARCARKAIFESEARRH